MKVAVIGASENQTRYSNICIKALLKKLHEVVAYGNKVGKVDTLEIRTDKTILDDIHTITLYIGPSKQPEWYDFILRTKPKRIIFNPGTENPELIEIAKNAGIMTIESCTLFMLSVDNF